MTGWIVAGARIDRTKCKLQGRQGLRFNECGAVGSSRHSGPTSRFATDPPDRRHWSFPTQTTTHSLHLRCVLAQTFAKIALPFRSPLQTLSNSIHIVLPTPRFSPTLILRPENACSTPTRASVHLRGSSTYTFESVTAVVSEDEFNSLVGRLRNIQRRVTTLNIRKRPAELWFGGNSCTLGRCR